MLGKVLQSALNLQVVTMQLSITDLFPSAMPALSLLSHAYSLCILWPFQQMKSPRLQRWLKAPVLRWVLLTISIMSLKSVIFHGI